MSQVGAAGAAAFLAPELTYAADALLGTALGHGLLDPRPRPHACGPGSHLADLFELGAANGTSVRAIVGEDPVPEMLRVRLVGRMQHGRIDSRWLAPRS